MVHIEFGDEVLCGDSRENIEKTKVVNDATCKECRKVARSALGKESYILEIYQSKCMKCEKIFPGKWPFAICSKCKKLDEYVYG